MTELATLNHDQHVRPGWPVTVLAPSPPRRLLDLAARLSRTMGLARALVQSGRTLDLTGVDDGVGMLCAQTLDLSTTDARAMLPALHDVLGQLDLLSVAVHAWARQGDRKC